MDKRPQYSQDDIDFVVLFASRFLNTHVSGYKPLLMEPPEEELESDGEEAPQHIVLKPQIEGDPLLTVGFIKLVARQAVLRSYAYMQAMHQRQFGQRPFHVAQPQYQSFYDNAVEFLQDRGMQIEIEESPPPEALPTPPVAAPAPGMSATMSWLLVVVVTLVAGTLAYLIASGRLLG